MKNLAGKAIASVAIASLALSPALVTAKTRAADSGASYPTSAPGKGRSAKGENVAQATGIILGLIGAGLVVGGIIVASDQTSSAPPASPGT